MNRTASLDATCIGNYDLSENPCKNCPLQAKCGKQTYEAYLKTPHKQLLLDEVLLNSDSIEELQEKMYKKEFPSELINLFEI